MFDRCLFYNVNALARVVNKHWNRAFAQYDLSPQHAYLLRAVLAQPGISPKQLAEILQLEKSTVTRFIDALEKKGLLIRKTATTHDSRSQAVYATAAGLELQEPLQQLGDELYQSMQELLGEQSLKEFVAQTRQTAEKLK